RGEAGAERTAALGAPLRTLGEQESAPRRELAAAAEGAAGAERNLVRLCGGAVAQSEGGDAELLRAEARTLVAAADAAAAEATEAADRARAAEEARVHAAGRAGRRPPRPHQLARVLAAAERLDETLVAAVAAAARFETPLRAQ